MQNVEWFEALIGTIVWGENVKVQNNEIVAKFYPHGKHACIADTLNADAVITATTATLQVPYHGLPQSRIDHSSECMQTHGFDSKKRLAWQLQQSRARDLVRH